MTYPKLPDELHNLEKSIYDCKNVIYDIEKSEKYADNLEEAVSAISTLYKVKFADVKRLGDWVRAVREEEYVIAYRKKKENN